MLYLNQKEWLTCDFMMRENCLKHWAKCHLSTLRVRSRSLGSFYLTRAKVKSHNIVISGICMVMGIHVEMAKPKTNNTVYPNIIFHCLLIYRHYNTVYTPDAWYFYTFLLFFFFAFTFLVRPPVKFKTVGILGIKCRYMKGKV